MYKVRSEIIKAYARGFAHAIKLTDKENYMKYKDIGLEGAFDYMMKINLLEENDA